MILIFFPPPPCALLVQNAPQQLDGRRMLVGGGLCFRGAVEPWIIGDS